MAETQVTSLGFQLGTDLPDLTTRRRLGAYYTPQSATEYLAAWAIRRDEERVLEPSLGDGAFLRAAVSSVARRKMSGVAFSGVEIDPASLAVAIGAGLIADERAYLGDFLAVEPFPVDVVIGNPPFVRLRHLPPDQRDRALTAAHDVLGNPMEPSGSIWLPFVLHAMRFLTSGGRMGIVLPYEATYVRYGRPLWAALGARFGSLRIIRTHERLFPDIYQDVVLLLADNFGGRTTTVEYDAYERIGDLMRECPTIGKQLTLADLVRGDRAFISALLPEKLRELLAERLGPLLIPARERATFNIGYVSGDKEFFHPNQDVIARHGLPARSLRRAVISTRALRGAGLCTAAAPERATGQLFLPPKSALSEAELGYVEYGDRIGVSRRYKCRVRRPWYVTPDTRVPDVLVSVFSERPMLMINDGKYLASNSLLCGFPRRGTAAELAAAWYTSLTLLQCELEIHALGGGVLVLIPGEIGNVLLPHTLTASPEHSARLDLALRDEGSGAAYRVGDQHVLQAQLGLSRGDIELVQEGVARLAYWRTSARSSLA